MTRDTASQSDMRDALAARLNHLAKQVGSVKFLADVAGVNRTQMSRYLAGTSVPRAELLAQVGKRLAIPLDWFFETGEPGRDLAELKFGMSFRNAVVGGKFQVLEPYMPEGFYLFWKQMFTDNTKAEVLLGKVYCDEGVHEMRISMIRVARKYGEVAEAWGGRNDCRNTLFMSGGNLGMISFDGAENIVVHGHLTKQTFVNRRVVSTPVFAGDFYCPHPEKSGRSIFVKGVLEKVPTDTSSLLKAGRRCGRFELSDLPDYIKRLLAASEE